MALMELMGNTTKTAALEFYDYAVDTLTFTGSEQCKADLTQLLQAIPKFQMWAIQSKYLYVIRNGLVDSE